MPGRFNEASVAAAVLAWLAKKDWASTHAPEIAPVEKAAERADACLRDRLRDTEKMTGKAA